MTVLPAIPLDSALPQPARAGSAAAGSGFTLVELVLVLVIAGILLAIGLPNFTDFVREQRVRSVASDLAGDFAYARAEAVRYSARVFVARAGSAGCTVGGSAPTAWRDGWCIFVDTNNNNTMDAGERLKVQQAVGPPVRICSTVGEFANTIIYGPRGQVVRTGAVGADDGITITDDTGGAARARTRTLMFGLVGRVNTVNRNFVTPPC